ncbi:MAG TPA: hypothetical protein VM121_03000 [Acidimicrobiales bacterium]|nr:hypothetical protein [Acidimicrobiales bacterium]
MAAVADLETWVREELSLAPEETVIIKEQPGTDPRCSSIVTEVAVRPGAREGYIFHVEQPLAEMTRMDLVAALAFGGGH